jgi:transposase-like protein
MDETACKNALIRIRWPRGFSCAHCGYARYYPISGRDQYECAGCGRQFSLASGTFMHRSRLPLRTWFEAASLYHADPGLSAAELARKLELTKPTAWLLLKKIRQGLASSEGRTLLAKMCEEYLSRDIRSVPETIERSCLENSAYKNPCKTTIAT